MKLRIIAPNLYNGLDRRNDYYHQGDILETSQAYGARLIKLGLAESYQEGSQGPQKVVPVLIPTAPLMDMEQISNIGSLSPLMDVAGINLAHITHLVNEYKITTMDDLKSLPVVLLRKMLNIPNALAKEVYRKINEG